jgi:hypothetical protein
MQLDAQRRRGMTNDAASPWPPWRTGERRPPRPSFRGVLDPNDKEVKAKQARKIRELGDALVLQGFRTLDQQAQALGLGRSTAWIILKANHKASGLSAAVINRMLAAPWLPPLVRAKMLEYIDEKIAGSYGHSKTQIRRFTARLSGKGFNQARTNEDTDIGLQRRKSNLRVVELRGTT